MTEVVNKEHEKATDFDECVSDKISVIADEHPDKEQDERVAIAYSYCRKKFGITKARILFLLEKSQLLELGLLDEIKTSLEKDMISADWIEFATLLKANGKKHAYICDRVNRSESWIKKYVNPLLKEVTPNISFIPPRDTSKLEKGVKPIHTILEFTITEIKKETRTFGGWGSVELMDSQEEVVSIKGLEFIMPTYMKRGAPIMFGHSNRHVGNVFKYQIKDKLVKDEYVPALWLDGQIFSDYEIDDQAWQAIQYAYTAGLPVLSLGATPIGHPNIECNDKECFKKYDKFQLYEFTITEQQIGSIGANPEATIEITNFAKSSEGLEVDESSKKLIGSKLVKMEKAGTLPETDMELVNMMLASCSSCQEDYLKAIENGKTEDQAKADLLQELVNSMNENKDEIEEVKKDEGIEPSTEETTEMNKSAPAAVAKEQPDLAAALKGMTGMLEKIFSAVTKTTSDVNQTNAETADSDAERKKTPEEKKKAGETGEPLEFSKIEKQIEKVLLKKGLIKIAETPAPATSEQDREITKGSGDPEKILPGPTNEEYSDAMKNWNTGGITDLAKKYPHIR